MSLRIVPLKFYYAMAALCLTMTAINCDRKADNLTVAEYQCRLLNLAFETASMIPLEPHIKDRCKTQANVVQVCLKLDQPVKAMEMSAKIENWQKGVCFADVALYYHEQNDFHYTERCLEQAEIVLTQIEERLAEDEMSWRRDHLKGKIEAVKARKKQNYQSTPNSNTVELDLPDKQIEQLDSLVATGGFDAINNALSSYVILYGRLYNYSDLRRQIEEKVKTSWGRLPYFTRIELLSQLAEIELTHSNSQDAVRFVNEAQTFIDSFQWPTDKRIVLTSDLIRLRFRCGDTEKAQSDAEAMSKLYEAERDKIVNIYRAGVLRTLAEAYAVIGNVPAAVKTYHRAIEDGLTNPNSRPRAEDLSATCCSMALAEIEPDNEIWSRMEQICNGLGEPW